MEGNTRIDRLLLDHGMDHDIFCSRNTRIDTLPLGQGMVHEISCSGDIISTILEQSVSPDVALHISYYYIIINVQAIPKFWMK